MLLKCQQGALQHIFVNLESINLEIQFDKEI